MIIYFFQESRVVYGKILPFLASLTFIFTICTASGADIDTVTARTVARSFYLNRLSSSSLGQQRKSIREIKLILIHTEYSDLKKASSQDQKHFSNPLYYVFNVDENDGFVIVPGDDRVVPVLGYAFTGHYPTKEYAPAFKRWMQNYREQIEYILKADLKAARFIMSHPDYLEGVRARLIDKDDNPRWQPDSIEKVASIDLNLS